MPGKKKRLEEISDIPGFFYQVDINQKKDERNLGRSNQGNPLAVNLMLTAASKTPLLLF